MARLPNELIERIKTEVLIVDLCREYGIELSGSGKNLMGRCPWHDDATASLCVTPSKNLWNCLAGCGGGDCIALVMKVEGVSFRRAAEMLAARLGLAPEVESVTTNRGTEHEILVDPGHGLSDAALMKAVAEFYHQTFLNQHQAMKYLEKRKCFHPEAVKAFQIGYANRTLGYRVPHTTKAGKDLKAQLTELGIYGRKGHEHLNGSVVFPIFDAQGNPVQMYGRKVNENLRKGTPKHLYLEQPKRGIWNRDGVEKQKEWLVCESILDALTLWCHGFRNVTCAFGVNGFNEDLWQLVEEVKPERVVICFDWDKAGHEGAEALSLRLAELGISTLRAQLPDGCDVNQLAVQSKDAQKALAALIEDARAMQGPVESDRRVEPVANQEAKPLSSLAADPLAAKSEPQTPNTVVFESRGDDELHATLGDRHYRVRGLAKNLSYETLKVQLKVTFEDLFHLDNGLDLCSHKAREQFVKAAAVETKLRPELLKRDVGRLLLALEDRQADLIRQATEPVASFMAKVEGKEWDEALELLRDTNLLERIIEDFERCGVVGEEFNLLVGYLAAVSRKFDKPLGIIIQSTSAAGKTTLMDAILAMIPEEDYVKYSAMTGQALFYLGETDIRHKILAVAEEQGAERATYALKLLQSEGVLTIASTGKDATTGRMCTEEYRVVGPVVIIFTTTNIEIDEELSNRCLVMTVDESRAQTRRIHQLQREARTLAGLDRKRQRAAVRKIHQNAQRLLRPLDVVNPYAPQLSFPDENTRLRRDQEKYLTLIDSIALLHQYQRPTKERESGPYIEVTLDDIAAANRLAAQCFGRTLDEMPPQTRRFLNLLWDHTQKVAGAKDMEVGQVRFSQRELREVTGWSHFQVKKHIARLVELEYLLVHGGGRGQLWQYELVYRGEGLEGESFVLGLIDLEKLGYDANRERVNGEWEPQNANREPSSSPQVAPGLRGGSAGQNGSKFLEEQGQNGARVEIGLEMSAGRA